MITYKTTRNITHQQLYQLYHSANWIAYTQRISDLTQLLTQANQVITAWDDDLLVGTIRTIGDNTYVELIQDIIVLPDYQHQGIGSSLLNQAIKALPDTIYQVFLLTDNHSSNDKALSFYRQHPQLTAFTDMSITGFFINPKK